MDSYVVRIYRRDGKNQGKVAGLVEVIEREQIMSFTCVEELLKILDLKARDSPGNIERSKRKPTVQKSNKLVRKKAVRDTATAAKGEANGQE